MARVRRSRTEADEAGRYGESAELALAALEEYLSAIAQDPAHGPGLQERARASREAIVAARGEWWQMSTELAGLRQRVAQLEGEVARLERYVGKLSSALDQSEWTSGA